MNTGIFIRHKGTTFQIEELGDKELDLFISNQRRYQKDSDTEWNWVKALVKFIREQPKRYVISLEQLEVLSQGHTILLPDGKKLMCEDSEDFDEAA